MPEAPPVTMATLPGSRLPGCMGNSSGFAVRLQSITRCVAASKHGLAIVGKRQASERPPAFKQRAQGGPGFEMRLENRPIIRHFQVIRSIISTSPTDYRAMKGMRLVRFDGTMYKLSPEQN
jgi:hypothetical protein